MKQAQLNTFLANAMRVRDPRAENPYAIASYCQGIVHGAMLAGQIDAATCTRLCTLVSDAMKHHYLKTPWPATGEWSPF